MPYNPGANTSRRDPWEQFSWASLPQAYKNVRPPPATCIVLQRSAASLTPRASPHTRRTGSPSATRSRAGTALRLRPGHPGPAARPPPARSPALSPVRMTPFKDLDLPAAWPQGDQLLVRPAEPCAAACCQLPRLHGPGKGASAHNAHTTQRFAHTAHTAVCRTACTSCYGRTHPCTIAKLCTITLYTMLLLYSKGRLCLRARRGWSVCCLAAREHTLSLPPSLPPKPYTLKS